MLDRDKLTNASSLETSRSTMAVADALQRFKSEEQVMGAAAFFLLICEVYGVYPGTALSTVSNMIRGNKIAARDQFNAAKMYIEKELKNG